MIEWKICWSYATYRGKKRVEHKGENRGGIYPWDEKTATRIAEECNRTYGQGTHWAERVKAPTDDEAS